MRAHVGLLVMLVAAVAPHAAARAQTPPSAPCLARQTCVDAGVQAATTTCVAQNPTCTDTNTDRLAIAAGVLADRAVSLVGCNTETFPTQLACRRCYRRARAPLKLRLDGKLFHGLLAHAAELVAAQQVAQCGSL